jgi:hypothetical protein
MGTAYARSFYSFLPQIFLLVFVALFCDPQSVKAQAIAEAAGATAVSGATTAAVSKTITFPASGAAADASPHLQASSGPAPQVVNRRELETHAGANASKLLIRSTPSVSQVWINDKFVGSTPMLLVLAPGKYRVSFRGPRMETGAQSVDLLPRETRELALSLAIHYPNKFTVR